MSATEETMDAAKVDATNNDRGSDDETRVLGKRSHAQSEATDEPSASKKERSSAKKSATPPARKRLCAELGAAFSTAVQNYISNTETRARMSDVEKLNKKLDRLAECRGNSKALTAKELASVRSMIKKQNPPDEFNKRVLGALKTSQKSVTNELDAAVCDRLRRGIVGSHDSSAKVHKVVPAIETVVESYLRRVLKKPKKRGLYNDMCKFIDKRVHDMAEQYREMAADEDYEDPDELEEDAEDAATTGAEGGGEQEDEGQEDEEQDEEGVQEDEEQEDEGQEEEEQVDEEEEHEGDDAETVDDDETTVGGENDATDDDGGDEEEETE